MENYTRHGDEIEYISKEEHGYNMIYFSEADFLELLNIDVGQWVEKKTHQCDYEIHRPWRGWNDNTKMKDDDDNVTRYIRGWLCNTYYCNVYDILIVRYEEFLRKIPYQGIPEMQLNYAYKKHRSITPYWTLYRAKIVDDDGYIMDILDFFKKYKEHHNTNYWLYGDFDDDFFP